MYFGLEEAFFKANFRRIKDKAARAHRKMVALEGFLWLSAGYFGGGKRIEEEEKGLERKRDDWRGGEMIGEEEKEEAEEARADGGGWAGGGEPFFLPINGDCGAGRKRLPLPQIFEAIIFYEITFTFRAGGLARCIVCQRC
ncbi:MAG: hypothetical protein SOU18_01805 [Alloprevotella sp.]|nr:hypothetical protein [Alloprevotella sp.]